MLPRPNTTFVVNRSTYASDKASYVLHIASIRAYVQASVSPLDNGFDGQGAYNNFIVMVNGNPDIKIGDQLVDPAGVKYYVDTAQAYSDVMGKHSVYNVNAVYD